MRAERLARSVLLPLILGLLGFALRVYRLGNQSLWYDEGFSAYIARLPLVQLLDYRGMDPHPPLHALVLGWWTALAGDSEVALRFPSVLAGTAAVLLVYRLGADLLGRRVGVYAALLAAVNPFLIFYAQETRPYSFLLVFCLGSNVIFLRLIASTPASRAFWGWYVAVTVLALWSHYFAAFTVAGQWSLWLAHWFHRRFAVGPWLVAQGVVALAFAPWVVLSLGVVTGYRAVGAPLPMAEMDRQTLTAFMVGPAVDPRPFLPTAAALGILTTGGLIASLLLRPKTGRWLSLLALLVGAAAPLAGLALLSLSRPTFHPRYLIAAAPVALVLAGALPALVSAWIRPVGWALLGGMALIMAGWTSAYYHDPRLARDDYRSAAAFVTERAQPEDAIVFHAWYTRFVFDYYFHGPQERSDSLRSGPVPEEAVVAQLNRLAARHRQLWLVLWQDEALDPGRYLLAQLDRHATRIAEEWLGHVRVFGYRLPEGPGEPFVPEGIQVPMQATLGETVELLGYRINHTAVAPGDTLRVAVYWRAQGPLPVDYAGFVHLIALRPEPWVFGQQDHPAGGAYYPSTRWQAGETVRDEYAFLVPREVPPGEYILETGLYTPGDFARLTTAGEGASPGHDSIFLTQRVTVQEK